MLSRSSGPITIEDLLRHTSGLTYGFYGGDRGAKSSMPNANLFDGDLDQRRIRRAHREAAAGRTAGDALGLRPFHRRARPRRSRSSRARRCSSSRSERLLDPLGMSETAFSRRLTRAKRPRIAEPMPDDRAISPTTADPRIRSQPRQWSNPAAAAWSARIGDYARFAQMLLNGGTFEGRRYLKPETVALMASDHIGPETEIARDYAYYPGATSGFGLGFAVRNLGAAEHDMAAGRIPLGRRRRHVLLHRSRGRHVRASSWCETPSQRGRPLQRVEDADPIGRWGGEQLKPAHDLAAPGRPFHSIMRGRYVEDGCRRRITAVPSCGEQHAALSATLPRPSSLRPGDAGAVEA